MEGTMPRLADRRSIVRASVTSSWGPPHSPTRHEPAAGELDEALTEVHDMLARCRTHSWSYATISMSALEVLYTQITGRLAP